MDEFIAYLKEVRRLQKKVYLYDELFCNSDSLDVLRRTNQATFRMFQEALNTEIILGLSALFDSEGDTQNPNLSQRYFVLNFGAPLTPAEETLKETTTKLLCQLNAKPYRHKYLGHKDLQHFLRREVTRHLLETGKVIELLDASYDLVQEIQVRTFDLSRDQLVEREKMLPERQSGKALVEVLSKI